jgi:hypothetical protein
VELGINVEGVQKWKITKRGAWNKRGGVTKNGKSINVEGGFCFVEGGFFFNFCPDQCILPAKLCI